MNLTIGFMFIVDHFKIHVDEHWIKNNRQLNLKTKQIKDNRQLNLKKTKNRGQQTKQLTMKEQAWVTSYKVLMPILLKIICNSLRDIKHQYTCTNLVSIQTGLYECF